MGPLDERPSQLRLQLPPGQHRQAVSAGGLDQAAFSTLLSAEGAAQGRADKDRGWWRGPRAPAPGPQSAASLRRAADASSLSGDAGQRRMLDLHVFE